jgi:hypothetical protein
MTRWKTESGRNSPHLSVRLWQLQINVRPKRRGCGGEELEANAESGTGADAWCGKAGEQAQEDKPESEEAMATKGKETDVEFRSMKDERNTKHALWPVEGQDTSMHPEEPQRVTDDDGRMTPLRGEYEEDNDDESRHDAREDGWEMTACAKAKDGAGTEPEGGAKGRVGEEEVGNWHVRFVWDAIGCGSVGRDGTAA